MFDLMAIGALIISATCAIGSSLWALSVYNAKRREQAARQHKVTAPVDDSPEPHKPEQPTEEHGQYLLQSDIFDAITLASYGKAHTNPLAEDVLTRIITLPATQWVPASITHDEYWENYDENWRKVRESVVALLSRRTAQSQLNLDVPHIDYMQFIETSTAEEIEDLLRDTRRYRSFA